MLYSLSEPHWGTAAWRQWHAFLWPAECTRPCCTVVLLQVFHSMQKETHTLTHKVRSNVIPSLSANASWQGEGCVFLHWLASDRWNPGAIRQTNDGFIRTCHWQVMNAALSKPYLERDKNWERGGKCYVGCSGGSFVSISRVCFWSVLKKRIQCVSNVVNYLARMKSKTFLHRANIICVKIFCNAITVIGQEPWKHYCWFFLVLLA